MKVRIQIDTSTFVRFWLVLIGFALALLLLYNARTALVLVGIAFFLAISLSLPVTKLASVMPGKSRLGGTALAFFIVTALIVMLVALIVPPIIEQTSHLLDTLPGIVSGAAERWSALGDFIARYNLQPQIDKALASASDSMTSWIATIGSNIVGALGSLFSVIFSAVMVLAMTFIMLLEAPAWTKRLWSIYLDKDKMKYHQEIVGKLYRVVTGYVNGQLTVSAIGAMFAALATAVLSIIFSEVPINLAFPVFAITFTLALIPMFGTTLAGILCALLILLANPAAGIVYGIYFIVYQQIENNFISPHIQSKQLSLTPLAILVSVTIGTYMFGLVGGIISIPIAGSIKVLLDEYLEYRKVKYAKKQKTQKSTLSKLIKKVSGAAED